MSGTILVIVRIVLYLVIGAAALLTYLNSHQANHILTPVNNFFQPANLILIFVHSLSSFRQIRCCALRAGSINSSDKTSIPFF